LTLTTPTRSVWNALRDEKTRRDYANFSHRPEEALPLMRVSLPEKVRGRSVRRHEAKHPGTPKAIRDSHARIASIGRTFMDMIDRPQWCGGMNHVITIWEEHAATYLDEIIEAVDTAPTSIVKMRAGHLLEERLGLRDARIDAWKQFAQRGSSRLLDPEGVYQPRWSETWMISLNV
jgi:predicted transcriptional regulator of viral defense system